MTASVVLITFLIFYLQCHSLSSNKADAVIKQLTVTWNWDFDQ